MEAGAQWWATGLENQAGHRDPRVRLLQLPLAGREHGRLCSGLLPRRAGFESPAAHVPLAARRIERWPSKPTVAGSTPARGTVLSRWLNGQSTVLLRRRSGFDSRAGDISAARA